MAGMKTFMLLAMVITAFPGAIAAEPVKSMTVQDFLLDVAELNGQTMAIRGSALCIGTEMCYLYPGALNMMQSVMFNPGALSREDRKRPLDCNPVLNFCDVVITGRVDAKAMITKLMARSISW